MKEIRVLAEAFSRAINSRNIGALDKIYGPAAVVWHSYDQVVQSRAQNLASLEALFQRAEDITYHDINLQPTERGFVQQHVLAIKLQDGRAYKPRPVCMVVDVKNGLITRIDEYLETGQIDTDKGST